VTGGYAAALGLIGWELSLSRGDSMAGFLGPIGIGVGAATIIFGFVKPNLYIKNTRVASIMKKVDITAVSSDRHMNTIGIRYTYSF